MAICCSKQEEVLHRKQLNGLFPDLGHVISPHILANRFYNSPDGDNKPLKLNFHLVAAFRFW